MIYAYALLGIIAASVYFGGRWFFYRSGKIAQKEKQNEKTIQNVEKVNKSIAGLTDDERKRLRDKYKYGK